MACHTRGCGFNSIVLDAKDGTLFEKMPLSVPPEESVPSPQPYCTGSHAARSAQAVMLQSCLCLVTTSRV